MKSVCGRVVVVHDRDDIPDDDFSSSQYELFGDRLVVYYNDSECHYRAWSRMLFVPDGSLGGLPSTIFNRLTPASN